MIITSITGFGMIFIFFVGFMVAGLITDQAMKRKGRRAVGWVSHAQKERNDRISTAAGVAGGTIAVVLASLTLILLPKDKVLIAWIILAAIGFLFVGALWLLMLTTDS